MKDNPHVPCQCMKDHTTGLLVCICDCHDEHSQAAQILGQRGGQKTAKRGPDYYREIGKRGAEVRWRKIACRRCGYCDHFTKTLEHLQSCEGGAHED